MFWQIFFGVLAALAVWSIRQYWGNIVGALLGLGILLGILGGIVWGVIVFTNKFPGWWKIPLGICGFIFVMLVLSGAFGGEEEKKPEPAPDYTKEII